ncbi:MAG: hypothetical protein MI757_16275 [Pirellulales bacterium]|nr:hypothetical protein [Pirellulales bacterium]
MMGIVTLIVGWLLLRHGQSVVANEQEMMNRAETAIRKDYANPALAKSTKADLMDHNIASYGLEMAKRDYEANRPILYACRGLGCRVCSAGRGDVRVCQTR